MSPERAHEERRRAALGVPAGAARVLVLCESSHWDTNWLKTSEGYFTSRIEPILAAVLRELRRDPQRVYCVESLFFLQRYWQRHPERRDELRALLDARRLRLLATSFTTPDTLLPHPEAIVRDYLLGRQWLRAQGLPAETSVAYLPDGFGHSPHLPSLLHALGVASLAVTRVDGMAFIAADYRPASAFPLRGSTAELLEREHRTLDFVWRADDGAEVLCHWNKFTYFQGDLLAHAGVVRWAGTDLAVSWRTAGHVARRLDGYVRQLAPFAKTPYLLCPIGMDFNAPIADLRPLLERYNRQRFGETGTWVVLAGLDDYLELVSCHRASLPVLQLDPNPYWMGFYASRPEVKRRPARLARALLLAESLDFLEPPEPARTAALEEGWRTLALINHHDCITGTSPDEVWLGEQLPWIERAEAAAQRALSPSPRNDGERVGVRGLEAPCASRGGGEVVVETAHYRLAVSGRLGGCLTSLRVGGEELLAGPGLDLVAFHDEGGLWRLGHEFLGGAFYEVARASQAPADVELVERGAEARIVIRSTLGERPFTRTVVCRADRRSLALRVEGAAARRLTVTCRLPLAQVPGALEMDTVGGDVRRPLERHYRPTFWPVPSRLSAGAAHLQLDFPTAVSVSPRGALEWIVARNAPKERAFRVLPVLAHPIGGTVDGPQVHEVALWFGAPPTPAERELVERDAVPPTLREAWQRVRSLVRPDSEAVRVVALKRAVVGAGLIVRLWCPPAAGLVRLATTLPVRAAVRCDALEGDLEPLDVAGGVIAVPTHGRLETVRLLP